MEKRDHAPLDDETIQRVFETFRITTAQSESFSVSVKAVSTEAGDIMITIVKDETGEQQNIEVFPKQQDALAISTEDAKNSPKIEENS